MCMVDIVVIKRKRQQRTVYCRWKRVGTCVFVWIVIVNKEGKSTQLVVVAAVPNFLKREWSLALIRFRFVSFLWLFL